MDELEHRNSKYLQNPFGVVMVVWVLEVCVLMGSLGGLVGGCMAWLVGQS